LPGNRLSIGGGPANPSRDRSPLYSSELARMVHHGLGSSSDVSARFPDRPDPECPRRRRCLPAAPAFSVRGYFCALFPVDLAPAPRTQGFARPSGRRAVGPSALPLSQVQSVIHVFGLNRGKMARPDGENSNPKGSQGRPPAGLCAPLGDLSEANVVREKMARLTGESSNALFEILEDWNEQLKHLEIAEPDLQDDFGGPQP